MNTPISLTDLEREEISEILSRRANEIAMWKEEKQKEIPASVEFACVREMQRLRDLSYKIKELGKENTEVE